MKTTGPATRIKPKYRQPVEVPPDFQSFLWDHPDGKAPLEKLILRTFGYGNFEQLKKIYNRFPEECYDIIYRYPDIKRGVKFWINDWHGKND